MDFNNAPDFGDLPMPATNDQAGFPPPPNFDVTPTPTEAITGAETAAPPLAAAATAPVDKKQFIYTLLIALFITLVIGSIAGFAVVTYLNQNAPPDNSSKYTFGSQNPGQVKPSPTKVASQSAAVATTPTVAPENSDWSMKTSLANLKLSTLDNQKVATVNATIMSSVEKDTYLCTSNSMDDNQYFTIKKSDKVFERLCDSSLVTDTPTLSCSKYDPDAGLEIKQSLYPKTDCETGLIEKGKYVMYSKVFYNCDLAGKALDAATPEDCKDFEEVYSNEMTVEE